METLILIMLWLLTCALCAISGYFYALKDKKHIKLQQVADPLTAEEARKADKVKAELSNFYKYDGSEQG